MSDRLRSEITSIVEDQMNRCSETALEKAIFDLVERELSSATARAEQLAQKLAEYKDHLELVDALNAHFSQRIDKAEQKLATVTAEKDTAVKDAALWREYKKVMEQAATEDALRIDLTLNHAGQAFGISAVLSTQELGSSILGIKAIGLAAEDQAQRIFASIDAALSKDKA